MNDLHTFLLLLILGCGVTALVMLQSARKREKGLVTLCRRILQNPARREAKKTSGRATFVPGLGEVHAALSAQITHAGETIDHKVSRALELLARNGVPAGSAREDMENLPRYSRERIAREAGILRAGLREDPARFLNLVHGIPKAGNSSLLATLWNSREIIGGAMSSHYLSEVALRTSAARANHALKPIEKFEHARSRRTRMMLGELGYLNDWPRPAGSPPPPGLLRIICPFRDPVASALSHKAYRMSIGAPSGAPLGGMPLANGRRINLPEEFAQWMETWVEHELNGLYGFDFLNHPFDAGRGYTVYDHGPIRLLVTTLEAIHRLPEAIAELHGCAPSAVRPVKTNDAASRKDADAYRRRLGTFRLAKTAADRIYSSRLMRHLYTDRQLETFIARWTTEIA